MHSPVAVLFANLKGNIGDFAILHAMLLDLSRRFPGRPLHVFPHGYFNIDEQRLAAFKASTDIDFEISGFTYHRRVTPRLVTTAVRSLGMWPLAQSHFVRSLAEQSAGDAARFKDYEAVVLAGGEHWSGTKNGISMFGTLEAAHRSNNRIFTFPFSVHPRIGHFNSRAALQRSFASIRHPLVVRDSLSQAVLQNLGIASVLGADCVHTLHELAQRIEPAGDREKSRILLAITAGRKTLGDELRTAVIMLQATGRQVSLLTTCATEDNRAYQAVAAEFKLDYLTPLTWQEAIAEMKASGLVITNRLHGLILSSLAHTPVLPLTNRKKAEAFVKDAGIPYSAKTPIELTRTLLGDCLADTATILQRTREYRENALKAIHSPFVVEHQPKEAAPSAAL